MNINFNLYWKLNWKLRFVNAKSIKVSRPATNYPPASLPRGWAHSAYAETASTVTSVRYARFLVFDFLFFFFSFFLPRFLMRVLFLFCVPNWIWAAFILMPFSVCLAHLICRTAQQRERGRGCDTHTQTQTKNGHLSKTGNCSNWIQWFPVLVLLVRPLLVGPRPLPRPVFPANPLALLRFCPCLPLPSLASLS